MFGFVNSTFAAEESATPYQIGLAFLSGQAQIGAFTINIVLTAGTAGIHIFFKITSKVVHYNEYI